MNNHNQVLDSPEFKKLVSKRWTISLLMTCIMLAAYFGYILTIAFNKSVLASKIGNNLTIGLPIGLGIIIMAWVMTGIYVYWANNYYDKSVTEIKDKIKS